MLLYLALFVIIYVDGIGGVGDLYSIEPMNFLFGILGIWLVSIVFPIKFIGSFRLYVDFETYLPSSFVT